MVSDFQLWSGIQFMSVYLPVVDLMEQYTFGLLGKLSIKLLNNNIIVLNYLYRNVRDVGCIETAHDGFIWDLDWHPLGHVLCSASNDHTW